MGVGGGVRQDVSLLDWLTILPFRLFALSLSFPRGTVLLFRWMVGAGRCGFRSKSATCSGMKSAADSDLKSAVPI